MFAQALTLALLLAAGLVTALGIGIGAEPATSGTEPGRGLI
jgi:hypothetical protein